jgi:GTPase involved in cell partitioning and DNA repair
MGKKKYGRSGESLIIRVPVGTVALRHIDQPRPALHRGRPGRRSKRNPS